MTRIELAIFGMTNQHFTIKLHPQKKYFGFKKSQIKINLNLILVSTNVEAINKVKEVVITKNLYCSYAEKPDMVHLTFYRYKTPSYNT